MNYLHNTTKNNIRVKTRTLAIALAWGGLWAAYLQYTRTGRWLANQRTYLTVVIGVGMDLLIALRELPAEQVVKLVYIVGASSVLIIFRSLANELHDQGERQNVIRTRR